MRQVSRLFPRFLQNAFPTAKWNEYRTSAVEELLDESFSQPFLSRLGKSGNNRGQRRVISTEGLYMEPGAGARLLELVEQHYTLLYRYGFRLSGSAADAEDLTQQTFLTAQSRLDQLRDPERAKAWLYTILRNHYLKECRHRNCVSIQSLETVAEPACDARDIPVDSERLQQVLNELPEEFRTPLILFYFEEFTYKDIAEQMEVPVGTVMSRLSRAKAFLRSRLATAERAPGSPDASRTNGTATQTEPQWTA